VCEAKACTTNVRVQNEPSNSELHSNGDGGNTAGIRTNGDRDGDGMCSGRDGYRDGFKTCGMNGDGVISHPSAAVYQVAVAGVLCQMFKEAVRALPCMTLSRVWVCSRFTQCNCTTVVSGLVA